MMRNDEPLVIILLLTSLTSMLLAMRSRPETLQNILLVFSSVFLGITVIEAIAYYASRDQFIITETSPRDWRQWKAGLGSLPKPNSSTEFKEFLDNRLIADVTYQIDANGLREIPASVEGKPYKVAFFGCSFMFGHGVGNDQTVPYYFLQAAARSVEGFNFAGEGWGPHQMLWQVETGFVQRVAGAPNLAIYEAIPDHLRRVAGRAPWEDGPKYNACPALAACYAGPFHDQFEYRLNHLLSNSWTIKFAENRLGRLSQPSDIPLFLAVLKRTRTLLETNGTHFVVLLWDQNELGKAILDSLKINKFDVIALTSIFPGVDLEGRSVLQSDRHPSPATNRAIAIYLWQHLGAQLVTHRGSPNLTSSHNPSGSFDYTMKSSDTGSQNLQ